MKRIGFAGAIPLLMMTAPFIVACGGSGSRSANHTAPSQPAPATSPQLAEYGLPPNYAQACISEGAICTGSSSGPLPRALYRPVHIPVLRPGEPCPATPGLPIANAYLAGIALGRGPVRVLIASAGDTRHGIVDLDPSGTPRWREFKTLWFSLPSYQGPFVIRAKRLSGRGPIRLGGSGGLPRPRAVIVVPPGPTANGGGGWRTAPTGTWATRPGCFAWQVDAPHFREVIVARVVLLPGAAGHTSR